MVNNVKITRSANGRGNDLSPERLEDVLERQYNVISREQATRYGMTGSQLRHRLRPGGPWQKILPGVYSIETGTVTRDQRQMAALLYAEAGAAERKGPGRKNPRQKPVLTGAAAVRRHRLNCAGGNDIEVLVPAESQVKGCDYVRIHRTKRMPGVPFTTRNIRYAPLARAAGDAIRAMRKPEDVRALISEVLHRGYGCTLKDLADELEEGPRTGSGLFRSALAEVSGGIRSEAEQELKLCIDASVLQQPLYNARLFLPDGTFLAMPDAWWPRAGVVGEVDSLSHHILAKDHEDTMSRRNRMEAAGIRVLQFLPKRIKPDWPIHLQHLCAAIQQGLARPPLQIITVPADVTDVAAFLRGKLGDDPVGQRP